MLAFLLQWAFLSTESRVNSNKPATSAAKPRGKGAKAKSATFKNWDPSAQLQSALDTMSKVLKLKLGKIFVTTSERDVFVGLFTRPVYLLLEDETRIKNTALRMHSFRVLCVAVKHHGHAYGNLTLVHTRPKPC